MLKKMPDWSLAALFWAWPQDGSLEGVACAHFSPFQELPLHC